MERLNWKSQNTDNDEVDKLNYHWTKDPIKNDLADAIYKLVQPRCTVLKGSLNLDILNEKLNELFKLGQDVGVKGKNKLQQEIFRFFFNNATALEQKWIIRIILKGNLINLFAP